MALTKLQGLEEEEQEVILYLLANTLNNFNKSAVSQEMMETFLGVSVANNNGFINTTSQFFST